MKINTRNEFPKLLNHLGLTGTAAEIGVFLGKFSNRLLSGVQFDRYYAIDPWVMRADKMAEATEEDKKRKRPRGEYTNADQNVWDQRYAQVKQLLRPFSCCQLVRKTSIEASKQFDDEAFDFIYIDGDHSYEACKEDLAAWWPKIKAGGILSGHDYSNPCGVKEAVDEFFGDKVQLTGTEESWYVIK